MSVLTCSNCGARWEASKTPTCPACLAAHWISSPNMITPKHDPRNLPSASSSFRSVVPDDLVRQPDDYYRYAAYSGTALYSPTHNEYSYVVGVPAYLAAGSAIPPSSAMPAYALDAFLVAKPFGPDAHIYAEGQAEVLAKINGGKFKTLNLCIEDGCDNLQLPSKQFCAKHATPPRAR